MSSKTNTYYQGRIVRDLWRHNFYCKDTDILEIVPMCGIFFLLISLQD